MNKKVKMNVLTKISKKYPKVIRNHMASIDAMSFDEFCEYGANNPEPTFLDKRNTIEVLTQ